MEFIRLYDSCWMGNRQSVKYFTPQALEGIDGSFRISTKDYE